MSIANTIRIVFKLSQMRFFSIFKKEIKKYKPFTIVRGVRPCWVQRVQGLLTNNNNINLNLNLRVTTRLKPEPKSSIGGSNETILNTVYAKGFNNLTNSI